MADNEPTEETDVTKAWAATQDQKGKNSRDCFNSQKDV